jgi:hypothetical protein
MFVLHVHAASLCCMFVLHIHAASQCCISVLHLHAACLCSVSALLVRAGYPCSMDLLHVLATCPRCMSVLHVHAAFPCCMFMLHVHTACPCCKSLLHVQTASMPLSMLHIYFLGSLQDILISLFRTDRSGVRFHLWNSSLKPWTITGSPRGTTGALGTQHGALEALLEQQRLTLELW